MRGGHLQEVLNNCNLTWKIFSWYFGKLVAEERKSLARGGHNWGFDCIKYLY